ncbi:MAG: FmdB family zinc ribbon protein [Candidatus Omnitrophota bacterium]
MPLYEYKCNHCHKTFEVLQKFNDEPIQKCLYCNGQVEKLISASSFQLKGSGWYVTDYKRSTSDKTDSTKATSSVASNIKSDVGIN